MAGLRSARRMVPEALEGRCLLTSLPPGFVEAPVVAGLDRPTAMEFAPDGRLFVSEQGGTLRVVSGGRLLPMPFVSLDVDSRGERGLLGIAFDPGFAANGFVYVYYTVPGDPAHNRVSRFTASGDVAVPGSEVPILDLDPLTSFAVHNGGAIHFGPDGDLYVAVGENSLGIPAQMLDDRLGKILRIRPDGSIPPDNPFPESVGPNRAIWALGLRNPFTFAIQPGTGRIFIDDVGQTNWEEIDVGRPGANYGWPLSEGPTTDPRFQSPLYAYRHDGTPAACAISGGTFYNPARPSFPADLLGDYFFADLCGRFIRRLDPQTGAVSGFATGLPGSPVDLKVDADGGLDVLVRDTATGAGQVVRIVSQGPAVSPLVGALYRSILGRPADPAGLAVFGDFLRRGGSPTDLALALLRSPEGRTRSLTAAYLTTLGRPPSPAEVAFGLSALASGRTGDALRADLLGGREYLVRSGGTRRSFLAALYRDVLGRSPTRREVLLAGPLATASARSRLAGRLLRSDAARGVLVSTWYATDLGRPAAPAEVAAWVGVLRGGLDADSARAAILSSPEFLQKAGASG